MQILDYYQDRFLGGLEGQQVDDRDALAFVARLRVHCVINGPEVERLCQIEQIVEIYQVVLADEACILGLFECPFSVLFFTALRDIQETPDQERNCFLSFTRAKIQHQRLVVVELPGAREPGDFLDQAGFSDTGLATNENGLPMSVFEARFHQSPELRQFSLASDKRLSDLGGRRLGGGLNRFQLVNLDRFG